MKLLWTRDTRLGGTNDFLTYFLREPVSHFALLFLDDTVIHWSLFGYETLSIEEFTSHRSIELEKEIPMDRDVERQLLADMKSKWNGSGYDFGYFFWLVYRAVLLLVANISIPYGEPANDTKDNMICHEGLESLPEDLRPAYNRDKANTPFRLYIELTRGDS